MKNVSNKFAKYFLSKSVNGVLLKYQVAANNIGATNE